MMCDGYGEMITLDSHTVLAEVVVKGKFCRIAPVPGGDWLVKILFVRRPIADTIQVSNHIKYLVSWARHLIRETCGKVSNWRL